MPVTIISNRRGSFIYSPDPIVGGEQSRIMSVNGAQVSGGPHTNFPVLISLTANNLKTVANGGLITSASGHDIRFFAADGITLLNWEVQSYDGTAGTLIAWAKIPSLTTTTTFIIRYGNAAITTFQGGSTGSAWTPYHRVWHMDNVLTAAGQTQPDSTSNNAPLTLSGTSTSGQTVSGRVGNAYRLLSANSNHFQLTSIDLSATSYTMEGWINISAADNTSLWWGRQGANNCYNWFNAKFRLYDGSVDRFSQDGTTSINTWYHYLVSRNGTDIRFYWNGVQDAFSTSLGAGYVWDRLGRQNNTNTANMSLDEQRIMLTNVSAGWAATNYATQNIPNTFITPNSSI